MGRYFFKEGLMQCVICRHGTPQPGTVTVTLEWGATVIVIKDVPAEVCSQCGEYSLDEKTTSHIMNMAEQAVQRHAGAEIFRYAA